MPIIAPVDRPLAAVSGIADGEATGSGAALAIGVGVAVATGAVVACDVGAGAGCASVGADRRTDGVIVGRGAGIEALGVGVGIVRMLGVGVGRLSGAMIGPEVGIGAGVGRVEGGRLKVTGGVVCGAALFDCAIAPNDHKDAGSIAAAASHTPARFKTLDPVIRVTL